VKEQIYNRAISERNEEKKEALVNFSPAIFFDSGLSPKRNCNYWWRVNESRENE